MVTNDFPPTVGGIQSYLRDFTDAVAATCGAKSIVVFASTQDHEQASLYDASSAIPIIRWPKQVMLPTPRTAEHMSQIIREQGIDTVWFGAAAPLGLMAGVARKAGAKRIVASTHGHEVGWSMLPGPRQALRRIGNSSDVVTYVSDYTRRRFSRAFGKHPEYVALPSGVDTDFFRPASESQRRTARQRYGYGADPLVVVPSRLVARKGQDMLIRVWPSIRQVFPDAKLAIIGQGPYEDTLRKLADRNAVTDSVRFHGRLEREDMRDLLAAADVMAMPARTRGWGLDVEGLGIVYLEAQACGIPVVAGDSGGAPETVTPESGIVVDGHSEKEITTAVLTLLADPERRRRMGRAGREHVSQAFSWEMLTSRLVRVLGLE